MGLLRGKVAHAQLTALTGFGQNRHLGNRFTVCNDLTRHQQAIDGLELHQQGSLYPDVAQRLHEFSITFQFSNTFLSGFAQVGGPQQHHRHSHINAADLDTSDPIKRLAGG